MVKAFPLNQQEYSYNAQDVSYYYAGRHSGVFALDTNCQVSVVSGMDIKVAKGKGWLAFSLHAQRCFHTEDSRCSHNRVFSACAEMFLEGKTN